MTTEEYEQKKRECWAEFCRMNPSHNRSIFLKKTLEFGFDRAYALGKEKETITQKDVEKAAEKYAERAYYPVGQSDCYEGFHIETEECLAKAFKAGANFALGKQEKDAEKQEVLTCEKSKVLYRFRMAEACKIGNNPESDYWIGYSKAIQDLFGLEGEPYVTPNDADTVIQGWVARDKNGLLNFFYGGSTPYKNDSDGDWNTAFGRVLEYLPREMFPDLTWESEPIEVELIIKRKKNNL